MELRICSGIDDMRAGESCSVGLSIIDVQCWIGGLTRKLLNGDLADDTDDDIDVRVIDPMSFR